MTNTELESLVTTIDYIKVAMLDGLLTTTRWHGMTHSNEVNVRVRSFSELD